MSRTAAVIQGEPQAGAKRGQKGGRPGCPEAAAFVWLAARDAGGDAAGATSETIVNMNASREIKVTKQWFYQKGNQVTEAKEPPEKDVYFKIKQVADSDGAESFYVVGADVPTSDVTPTGYDPVKSSDSNGTIFHLVCTSTTTETPSELDPTKMVSTRTSTPW